MAYRIEISKPAAKDTESISFYIAQEIHAPQAAFNLLVEIDEQISGLKEIPKKYPLVKDERLAFLGIRKIAVKNYLIFYSVDDTDQKITIVRLLYAKRDWANLL